LLIESLRSRSDRSLWKLLLRDLLLSITHSGHRRWLKPLILSCSSLLLAHWSLLLRLHHRVHEVILIIELTWRLFLWSPCIFQFSFENLSLLILKPFLMLESSFILILLLFEISSNFLKSLFLEDLFNFCSHCWHLLILIHFISVKFRINRKLWDYSKGIIFLRCKIHQCSFFNFKVFTTKFILSKNKIFWKRLFFSTSNCS